jgi:fermentation-respiration switch protein FrsA (DUF1100 family)
VVSERFDSVAKIGRCRQPVFIAQADRDRVIPFAQGERLRAACGGPVERYRLEGLDHNDPLPQDFFTRLREFLQNRAPGSGNPNSETPCVTTVFQTGPER